jgi:hypothetical protein
MSRQRRFRIVVGLGMRNNMGKGIDLARDISPEHASVMDDFKDQLLIVFLKRLGGKVSIPIAEIDDTGRDMLAFRIDEARIFHFETRKKS